MQMTQEEFDRERRYQTFMYLVRKMLEEGLVSEEEYCQIDTKYQEKFLPVTGNLLSGIALLSTTHRGNMSPRKEA